MTHSLRCPETGTPFAARPGTAIHAAGELEYPQIDGIPTLQTRARSRAELDAHLAAVRAAGRDGVLDWLSGWSAAQGHNFHALRRVVVPGSAGSFAVDWSNYCGARDAYFLIRWGCASYLSNLAFLDWVAGRRVACLASGVGHFSNLVQAISPRPRMTVLDGNLIYLLVLKAYFAPDEQAVCAELDDPLPLPDAAFDAVMMNDALHYVDRQAALLGEIRRVVGAKGWALLLHVHDPRDLTGETVPGRPVAPVQLARMARARGWRDLLFFPERALSCAVVEGRPALDHPIRDPAQVPPGPYAACLFQARAPSARPWRLALDRQRMMLNPIYVPAGPGAYRIDWWSDRNRREFGDTPLPQLLTARELAQPCETLFRRGLLVPDPNARLAAAGMRQSMADEMHDDSG